MTLFHGYMCKIHIHKHTSTQTHQPACTISASERAKRRQRRGFEYTCAKNQHIIAHRTPVTPNCCKLACGDDDDNNAQNGSPSSTSSTHRYRSIYQPNHPTPSWHPHDNPAAHRTPAQREQLGTRLIAIPEAILWSRRGRAVEENLPLYVTLVPAGVNAIYSQRTA